MCDVENVQLDMNPHDILPVTNQLSQMRGELLPVTRIHATGAFRMSNVETQIANKAKCAHQTEGHPRLREICNESAVNIDSFANSSWPIRRIEEMQFKVALSFPGERRAYVRAVAKALRKKLQPGTVFYDKDFASQLAIPNLDTMLQRIYLNNSDLVVVFLCSDYDVKEWCGIEWRAIREIIKHRGDHRVMPMRFDQSSIPGFFSIDGYVDLSENSPAQAARMILERVRLNELT